MRLRTTILPLTIAALGAAAPAHAAFFKAESIDQGAGIQKVGAVDLARDGSGAVTYVKSDGGANHVFVSRLVSGVFQPSERVDPGLLGAGSDPVVAVSDGGRIAVVYVSGGQIFAAVRPAGAAAFSAPQVIAAGSAPSVDMSINGVAYTSFTARGASAADVRVARLEGNGTTFAELPDALDVDPARDAGVPGSASQVAVSADGTAVVVWGEGGHVYGRRVFQNRISTAPQDLTVDTLGGHTGNPTSAVDPHIEIQDDSSFAQVTFRQSFDDGRSHTIARRLVGSQFDPPVQVDGLGFGGDAATSTGVGMNGRGEGLATTGSAAKGTFVSLLHDNMFFPAAGVGPANNIAPLPVGDLSENNNGYVAWMQGTGPDAATVQGVSYDVALDKRTVPAASPVSALSNPDFGPVDVAGGLDMAVDRVGDAVAVFVQGTGDGRRIVAAGFARLPGTLSISTTQRFRRLTRPPLAWSPSFDLWGPITYTVTVGKVTVGQSTDTRLTPTAPIADGVHPWTVTATDRRGQTTVSKPGVLRIDSTPPRVSVAVSGTRAKGSALTVRAAVSDPRAGGAAGSGIARVAIDFGDGARTASARAKHAYRTGGKHTIKVSATDRAGNVKVVRKTITIK